MPFEKRQDAFDALLKLTRPDGGIPQFQKGSVNWLLRVSKRDNCEFKHRDKIREICEEIKRRGWA